MWSQKYLKRQGRVIFNSTWDDTEGGQRKYDPLLVVALLLLSAKEEKDKRNIFLFCSFIYAQKWLLIKLAHVQVVKPWLHCLHSPVVRAT